jgi:hypothetical protein
VPARRLRAALLAATATAWFAAPVSAEVVALSGFRAAGTPRLDRDHVYWLQEGRGSRVVLRRASIAGTGVERIGTFSAARPGWHYWRLLVSGRRLGVIEVLPGDLHQDTQYVMRYGRLGGPYATKQYSNGERGPYVGGPYLIDAGVGFLANEPRTLAIESPVGQRSLAVPPGSAYTVRAGRIAVAQPDRVLVVDTGAASTLRSLSLPPRPAGARGQPVLELDTDGGVVVQFADSDDRPVSTLYAPADDTALRPVRVPETISAFSGGKVAMVGADGDARHALVRDLRHGGKAVFRGPPGIAMKGLSVAGDSVAWTTGVCQFVASFARRIVRRVPAGPCPRTVPTLHMKEPAENMQRDRVSARVGCLTSDRGACRISLRMRLPGSPAFALRAPIRVVVGRAKTIRMHLPPVLTRCARALSWALDAVGIDADGGRRGHFYDSYGDPPESLENASFFSRGGVRRCRAARSYLRRR